MAQNIRQDYDPVKAHAYYERTKKLKGRTKGAAKVSTKSVKPSGPLTAKQKAQARVGRLRGKVARLKKALSETEAELSKKLQEAKTKAKENSDGKTTAKERQSSKQYRDKHKQELASKRKKESSSDGSSSSSQPKTLADMSTDELAARANKIRATIKEAQRQLSNANQQLGQLAHSAILSEPDVNELFAHFQSAEGIPSK